MPQPTPNAARHWDRFAQTGCPEDYLAYRTAKEAEGPQARGPQGQG